MRRSLQTLGRLARAHSGDPRVLWLYFCLLLDVSLLSPLPFDGRAGVSYPAQAALIVGLVGEIALLVVAPYLQRRRSLMVTMCVLAIAVIGICAVDLDTAALPLVVLPAMELARHLRWWAVPAGGLATALLVALPTIALHGNADNNVPKMIPLPLVVVMATAAVAVALDVTRAARRQQRAALAEVDRHRRAIDAFLETVDVGLQLCDAGGEVALDNSRMRELLDLKWPLGHGAGTPHIYDIDGTTLLPPDCHPGARARRGEEFDDVRIWTGANPAERRALSVTARNVVDEDGGVGTAMAYQDVTDLMRALAVKDEFIGLVSHELRTPLTSIYGYVCLLQDRDDLPAQAAKHLEVVGRSTDRLRILVNDLLEATQVAGAGLRLERFPCGLRGVVRDAVQAAAPHAERAGIELRVEVPGDDKVEAVVDRTRVAQVLDNLISNAIKYTPTGGRATVTLERGVDDAVISVGDSGIGIRPEDQGRVFGQFFRTREASERAIQGAGLGLAITRTIVEAHGGRIEVRSRPGEGSTFTVTLPLRPVVRVAASA